MSLDKLLTVTRRVCQIEDDAELTAMLNFYHDLGVIVKHGHTVVLQAQWLINLFKQLITVRPFKEVVSKSLRTLRFEGARTNTSSRFCSIQSKTRVNQFPSWENPDSRRLFITSFSDNILMAETRVVRC